MDKRFRDRPPHRPQQPHTRTHKTRKTQTLKQDVCTFAWLYGDGSSAAGVLLSAPIELGGACHFHTYIYVDNRIV